jgi:glutamate-1-semialdehyde 2,1-aminomutase
MVMLKEISMSTTKSHELFQDAAKVIPGGVNSPVRAFKSVGGDPIFVKGAKGCKLYDVDGNEYIDYVGSWGPMIVGHANDEVIDALTEVMKNGTSFGAPTEKETVLANAIIDAVPSIEMVRLVSSGTEATMSAIRLARGYTGRDKIIKFEGCYHGHADGLLVKAGSGALTLGVPTSPGVPADYAKNTLTVSYNDLDSVKKAIAENPDEIACIIIEPLPGNMGVIPPREGFLEGLRQVTEENGIVLIFDEVMSGFRVAYGGFQEVCGVTPDMTTLGKVIGGGLPVGAFGGKREIMEKLAPAGPVYQAGTLSGNPLAVTAGLKTLEILKRPGSYEKLEALSEKLCEGVDHQARLAGIDTFSTRVGAMFCLFFNPYEVFDYASATSSDTEMFSKYFSNMLNNGVYLAPSQFEAAFMSLAHTDEDIEKTIAACAKSLTDL